MSWAGFGLVVLVVDCVFGYRCVSWAGFGLVELAVDFVFGYRLLCVLTVKHILLVV